MCRIPPFLSTTVGAEKSPCISQPIQDLKGSAQLGNMALIKVQVLQVPTHEQAPEKEHR